jgi:hypothetical protein
MKRVVDINQEIVNIRNAGTIWIEHLVSTIREARHAGYSDRALASALGCAEGDVRSLRLAHGIEEEGAVEGAAERRSSAELELAS